MLRAVCILLAILSLVSGCRAPEPRSPDLVRQKAAEPPEPSIFDRLPLNPPERSRVNDLLVAIRADLAAYDQRRLELLDMIVVQVRLGAFDRQKLDPIIERTIVEYERATPKIIAFANQVHAALSPTQRQQLVALWNDDGEKLSEEEQRAKEEEELTRVLDLTGSQKTRLVTPLLGTYLQYYGPIGDFRKAWSEAKAAFVKDQFDAGEQAFFTELPLRTLARAVFEASSTVLGALSPEQRETLAVTIETHWRR